MYKSKEGDIVFETIKKVAELNGGYICTRDVLDLGINKVQLKKYVDQGYLEKVNHGIYQLKNFFTDDYYEVALTNKNIVFSHETALYLHGYTNRVPNMISVTVPSGHNLHKKNLKYYYTKQETINLGVIQVLTENDNPVNAYDIHRTICDIIKNQKRIEQQVYLQGIQNYFNGSDKNIRMLLKYAKVLNIEEKVLNIVQLFYQP